MPKLNKKNMLKLFLLIAAGIVLYWLLHEAERVKVAINTISGIFSPFIMGAAVAFVLNVPMRAFEKWFKKIKHDKLRRIVAIVLTIIAFLIVLGAVGVLLIFSVIDAYHALETKLNDYEFLAQFFTRMQPILSLDLGDINLRNMGLREVFSILNQTLDKLGSSISVILSGAVTTVGKIGTGIVNLIIAVVFGIYCLFDKEKLARQGRKLLYAFAPEKFADETVRILRLSNATFSNFLSGQCIEVCILGAMFAVTMAIFKMPFVALISILIAITAFIPIVGAFAGCIVGAVLILMKNPENPMQAVLFVIIFLVIQQIEGNLIYPHVVGNSVGLSGMWVLMAITIGGKLFGIVGMFLMIPVVSVFYTVVQEKTHKKLADKDLDPEKLKAQPPELQSRRKENRQARKAKRAEKNQENASDTSAK